MITFSTIERRSAMSHYHGSKIFGNKRQTAATPTRTAKRNSFILAK